MMLQEESGSEGRAPEALKSDGFKKHAIVSKWKSRILDWKAKQQELDEVRQLTKEAERTRTFLRSYHIHTGRVLRKNLFTESDTLIQESLHGIPGKKCCCFISPYLLAEKYMPTFLHVGKKGTEETIMGKLLLNSHVSREEDKYNIRIDYYHTIPPGEIGKEAKEHVFVGLLLEHQENGGTPATLLNEELVYRGTPQSDSCHLGGFTILVSKQISILTLSITLRTQLVQATAEAETVVTESVQKEENKESFPFIETINKDAPQSQPP